MCQQATVTNARPTITVDRAKQRIPGILGEASLDALQSNVAGSQTVARHTGAPVPAELAVGKELRAGGPVSGYVNTRDLAGWNMYLLAVHHPGHRGCQQQGLDHNGPRNCLSSGITLLK